jgi:hypothetical protein
MQAKAVGQPLTKPFNSHGLIVESGRDAEGRSTATKVNPLAGWTTVVIEYVSCGCSSLECVLHFMD